MIDEATIEKVKDHYNRGDSAQAIARSYRLTVEEVLSIIGRSDIATVTIPGDQIDPNEVGQGAHFNQSETVAIKFDLN